MKDSLTITGGFYKGQKIASPGGKTHPMGERERMAIMNSIMPYLDGASVIDYYAGSGALGIEALSRGAKKVIFYEKDKNAYETINQNTKKLGIDSEKASVILSDVKNTTITDEKVLIFDPPYDKMDEFNPEKLNEYKNADVIVISHPKDYFLGDLDGFRRKDKNYAGCSITIFTKNDF